LNPSDVIWQVSRRLRDDLEHIANALTELHPVKHKDVADALHEVELLMHTQINILDRVQRRYETGGR
jgi:hypothetical protein